MTGGVALVASPGGHVDEAFEIADRFAARDDRVWITAKTMQTTTLLRDEHVEWVPEVKSREATRALRSLPIARRALRAYRPTLMVSTGSALTVPYMTAARALRIPVTYVESATRMDGPSITGRISEWIPGIDRHYQSAGWERRGWQSFGSIFDRYEVEPGPASDIRRLLVTVGSEKYPFQRALETVRVVAHGKVLIWQTGNTPVRKVLPGQAQAWWSGEELATHAQAVDAVVTHAGVGSILMVLRTGKCPVVIPRTKRLGEHIDNHQLQLARMLHERGMIILVKPGDDVESCLAQASGRRIVRRNSLFNSLP